MEVNCPNCGKELFLEQVSVCAGCKPVLLRRCRCGFSEPVVEEKKTSTKAKVNLQELRKRLMKLRLS